MTLRPVLRDEVIQMPATDSIGFVRKPAPGDGFAVDYGETCGFLSRKEVQAAMVGLQMLIRRGPR